MKLAISLVFVVFFVQLDRDEYRNNSEKYVEITCYYGKMLKRKQLSWRRFLNVQKAANKELKTVTLQFFSFIPAFFKDGLSGQMT